MSANKFCEETRQTYLNIDCPLWKGLFLFFLGVYKQIRWMWGLGFSIKLKKKREIKGGGSQKEKEKLHLFLIYPKLCSHMFYSLVFQ